MVSPKPGKSPRSTPKSNRKRRKRSTDEGETAPSTPAVASGRKKKTKSPKSPSKSAIKKKLEDQLSSSAAKSDNTTPPLLSSPISSPSKKASQVSSPPAAATSSFTPQLAVQVHRFRNANYIPKGILKLCATPPPSKEVDAENINAIAPHLAISREGGSVELVSVDENWKCVSTVEGMKKRNVDSMAWICGTTSSSSSNSGNLTKTTANQYYCRNHEIRDTIQSQRRLFGSSRDGTIFEIDFHTKSHVGVIGSGGGAVFCLTSGGEGCCNLLAAGCEDGSVRIFKAVNRQQQQHIGTTIDMPSLELISTLPSVGCAVTSIAWLPPPSWLSSSKNVSEGLAGSILYAGVADGTIRKFIITSTASNARAYGSVPHAVSTGMILDTSDETTDSSVFSGLQWKASARLTVENRGSRVATKIWSLLVLDDGTLVSGDSMGHVQFWDGHAGTFLQTFEHNTSNADVLDLALNLDQTKVMASGVDSRVICIELDQASTKANRWVLSNQQRFHTHDVNSLAMVYMTDSTGCAGGNVKSSNKSSSGNNNSSVNSYRELLCSGGVDTKVNSYFVSNMRKYRPKVAYKYPSNAPIVLSRKPRLLSIMRSDCIDFYQLGDKRPSPTSGKSAGGIALDEEKALLGSVRIASNYNLISFDLNDDGTLLAVSHAAGLHLFSLEVVHGYEQDDDNIRNIIKPTKIDVPIQANTSSTLLKFSKHDPNTLVTANLNGSFSVIRITRDENKNEYNVSLEHTIDEHDKNFDRTVQYPVTHLDISPDGRWFAAGRNTIGKGSVKIYELSPTPRYWWTVPCTEAPFSCLKWLGNGDVDPALAVALNNGAFYLFDAEQRCLSDWSQDLGFPASPNLPKELSHCLDRPDRLAFNPATPSKFLMVSYMLIAFDSK